MVRLARGDFFAGRPAAFSRAFYVQGTPAADLSSFSNNGFFLQSKWEVTPRLTLTGGARTDDDDEACHLPVAPRDVSRPRSGITPGTNRVA